MRLDRNVGHAGYEDQEHPYSDEVAILMKIDRVPEVYVLFFALYSFYDAFSIRSLPYQRILYALILLLCIGVIVIGVRNIALKRMHLNLVVGWLSISTVYLIPITGHDYIYLRYIVGDYISILLPLLLLLVGVIYPRIFLDRGLLLWLILLLFLSSIFAGFNPDDVNGRYEPPALMVVAFVWLRFFCVRSIVPRMWWFLTLISVLFLAYYSGERTTALLWFLAGGVMYFLVARRNLLSLSGTILAVSVLLVLLYFYLPFGGWLQESRFSMLIDRAGDAKSLQLDNSVQLRIDEAYDVITTAKDRWSPGQYLIGGGHGATYEPERSFMEPNETREGMVHNIHIGPILVFFRYGIIGTVIFLIFVCLLLSNLYSLRNCTCQHETDLARIFFTISLLIYIFSFLLRNVMVDPLFSYILAGYIYTTYSFNKPEKRVVRIAAG